MTQKQAEMQWNAAKVEIAERKAALKLSFAADQAAAQEDKRRAFAKYDTERNDALKDKQEFVEKLHELKRRGLAEWSEDIDAQRRLIANCDKQLRDAKTAYMEKVREVDIVLRDMRIKFESDIAAIKADGKRQQAEIFSQIEKSEKPTNPDGENVSE